MPGCRVLGGPDDLEGVSPKVATSPYAPPRGLHPQSCSSQLGMLNVFGYHWALLTMLGEPGFPDNFCGAAGIKFASSTSRCSLLSVLLMLEYLFSPALSKDESHGLLTYCEDKKARPCTGCLLCIPGASLHLDAQNSQSIGNGRFFA